MPHSDWRSSETYDRIQEFEPTGFAWEWLRRNPDYHRDHRQHTYSAPNRGIQEEMGPLLLRLTRRGHRRSRQFSGHRKFSRRLFRSLEAQ